MGRVSKQFYEMYRMSDEQYAQKKRLRGITLEKYDYERFIFKFQTIANRLVGMTED